MYLKEDEDGDTKLHFAAALGHHSKLLKYIKVSHNINSANRLGWTPLMQACRNGHLTCATSLIQNGADVSYKNQFGVCSLSLAAASGNVEIVHLVLKSLLRKNVTVSQLENVVSPTVFSILFNCIDVLRYFINNSFDLKKTNFIGGVSSIRFAEILNNTEIMSLLNRRGLRPLSISVTPNTSRNNSVSNSPFLIPATPSPVIDFHRFTNLITIQSPALLRSPNLLQTPNSGRSLLSPSLSPRVARKRKCSNISRASSIHTPSISPISMNNSSLILDDSLLNNTGTSNKSSNVILNQRFSISPQKLRFSSTSSTESLNASGNFLKPITRKRNQSFYVPPTPNVTPTKVDDDVFEDTAKRHAEFIEMLRRYSLDGFITIFEKHEIDMDLFLTLSKNDLQEIGIDYDKQDALLEVIHQLNKQ